MLASMLRLHMPSPAPLFVAAGLCVLAIITAWPEPLAGGWEAATLAAVLAGAAASLPFWNAAGRDQRRQGKSVIGGIALAILAGMLVGGTLLHLANATMPGSRARAVVLTITDKYVTSGRRGRKTYHVITAPVPGLPERSGHHTVGGLFESSGTFDDYRIGGCMALTWRPGWWWPVVVRRAGQACPVAAVPLARPGQAWALVQQRLAAGLDALDLPPEGLLVSIVVNTDANGMITAIHWINGITAYPEPVTRLILQSATRVPFAIAGPAGEYRLWLKLVPADKGGGQGRI
jgi:hypothetical protein